MNIQGKVILVTGANRGVGKEFVSQAVQMGARKVYACSRKSFLAPSDIVTPVTVDVTDPESIARCALACGDTDILINNAGILERGALLSNEGVQAVRRHVDVNAISMLEMAIAFAPVLKRNGGGAIVNMLSVLSWISIEHTGAYSASKAVAWALSNAVRLELRVQNTQVLAIHPGYLDTDMTAGLDVAKMSTGDAVRQVFEALQRGDAELVLSEIGLWVKQNLSSPTPPYLA